ncbi:MAG: uracil-DNA glycosylase [Bacillota bacterium]
MLEEIKRRLVEDGYNPEDVDQAVLSLKKEAYWSALRRQILTCRRCPFGLDTRASKQRVPGAGYVLSPLMLVGEGPGFDEDRVGVPFTGISGALLTLVLGKLGLKREDIYITNVLKCRPANNRTPNFEETKACSYFLQAEIRLIRPRAILALGRVAAQFFWPGFKSIKAERGRWLEYNGIPVLPTYHPAYLLRQAGNDLLEAKKQWWADFYLVVNKAYGAREHQV